MIIKSQNGDYLVNFAMIDTIGFLNGCITAYRGEDSTIIGNYSSDERCEEIIAEIAEYYNKYEYAKFMGCENASYISSIFQMPKE